MQKEIQELYDYLKLHEEEFEEGISIYQADEIENTDYIQCIDKSIILVNGKYHITDFYDSHPCFEFKTKEDVYNFLLGCKDAEDFYFSNLKEDARHVGRVATFNLLFDGTEKKYGYEQYISKTQRLINQE